MSAIESPGSVSSTIRSIRKSLGLSQKEIARQCRLSQSTIARLEGDIERLNPSYAVVYSVLHRLGELSESVGAANTPKSTAYSIMHRNVVALRATDTVDKAIRIIKNYDFMYIPVMDKLRTVLGTVRQKDVLDIATNRPRDAKSIRVGSIMSPSLPQVDKSTSVTSLKPIIETSGSVLVTEKGRLLGIITAYDVLKLV